MAKITKDQWEKRINEAGAGQYEFVRWLVDSEFGSNHRCVVKCVVDGFEWTPVANNLVGRGSGCPKCNGVRRWTAEERIEQINKLEGIEFVCWENGYKNARSMANVRCMNDGFSWRASINVLVHSGCGCPQCSGLRRWTEDERIEQINSIENIEFLSWEKVYKGSKSKVNVRCANDGFTWSATVSDLVNRGSGCAQCAGKRIWTAEDRIDQINKIENIEFVCWDDSYRNSNSKANVRCMIHNIVWSCGVHSLVNVGSGCPKCAKYGFNKVIGGFLYALRSECGSYVKIGISNKPSQRHRQLEIATPFKFNIVEQLEGDGTKIAELEKYFHNKYESAGFKSFDGATEWLVCTPELIEELRGLGDK